MQTDKQEAIIQSWTANAGNWINTIDSNALESRILVTNDAIVKAIADHNIAHLLDIGCGEGWLTRTLNEIGIKAFGIDAIPELIDNAISKSGDHFAVCSYEQLIHNRHELISAADGFAFNFSLLDEVLTDAVITCLGERSAKGSHVFIQTLHPLTIAIADRYESGWKEGSWSGLSDAYVLPYQWYFRTLHDWVALFIKAGFTIKEIREPLHPVTGKPASIIFIAIKV